MRKRNPSRLHLLSVLAVRSVAEAKDYSDGGGLMLRVTGSLATWVFRYTAATGKRREMGLGAADRANAVRAGKSLTDARALAASARLQLQQGIDPIDERARLKDATREVAAAAKAQRTRQAVTLARAARDYHERVIEPKLTAKHAGQWIMSLEHHVPEAVWHKPIADIEPPELLRALAGVRALADGGVRVPETLSRVRQRLDAVFEDAIFHRLCNSNPAQAIRRKMRETVPAKQAGRFAALPYRELPGFMAALQSIQGTAARSLDFALHTASRTSEVLFAQWSEVDLQEKTWTIGAERMKAGEEHVVYLSARALEIVRDQIGVHQRWVFPSTMVEGPQSNMAMLAVLDRMGMRERTTVHGVCRATFSTWANDTGAARPDVIEACLAHREADRVKAAYNRAQFREERRALMTAWAAHLATPLRIVEAA